jgi:pentatricopeptide repeat protein
MYHVIMIKAFCEEGAIHKANSFFKEMQQNGISPNVVTYITLIHGFCMDVNIEVTLKLLRDKAKKCFVSNN